MIKNKDAIHKMYQAGQRLASIFEKLPAVIHPGISTGQLDAWIESRLNELDLKGVCKGYFGYQHVSCISINDQVVHGVPSQNTILQNGDLIKVDVCASFEGYCADMARCFFVEDSQETSRLLVEVAQKALDQAITKAQIGSHLSDISHTIQQCVEHNNFGVVRDFAGHGIGKKMHEDPEILNYGKPGRGPILKEGMALAIEPMITAGHYAVYVASDKWTVRTVDKSLAAHIEDTIIVLQEGPLIITRISQKELSL